MHKIKLEGARETPCMWSRLRRFLRASPDGGFEPGTSGADEAKARRFRECKIMSRHEACDFHRRKKKNLADLIHFK